MVLAVKKFFSFSFFDSMLGRFKLWRFLRGGYWYGGGMCIRPESETYIPWVREKEAPDIEYVITQLRNKYFRQIDEQKRCR